MRRAALLFAVLGVLSAAAPAAALEIHASLDRDQVPVGQQVVLTIVVQGGVRSLPEPDVPDLSANFEVYTGSTSRNFSLVNGRVSASLTRRIALVPRREGTFTIAPITAEAGGETATAQALKLEVTKAAAPPTPPPETEGETGASTGSDDVFVRATVDKTDPYVYEQVTYRMRLYTRLNLLDNPGFTPPSTEGFWKESLPPRQPYLETVNGKRYRVLEVSMAVFPTTPGKLTVGEAVVEANVEDPRSGRDPRSFFRGGFMDGERRVLRTDPVTLDVRPLPPGAPPDFAGAVGDYRLSVSTDRTEVEQNSPVTLTVKITGEGNLRTLGDIDLPALPDFRAYPSASNEETGRRGSTISGTITKQFILVPLSAGRKVIPPIQFSVFSPTAESYRTLSSDPIAIQVAAGGGGSGSTGGSRSDIELLGRDIRFIETDLPAFTTRGGPWARVRGWLFALPLPPVAYALFWGWERRRRRLGADLALSRRLRAAREARALLKRSQGASAVERAARAADAVRGYLADLYNLPRAGITPADIETRLSADDIDPAPVTAFLDRCDAARFAPDSGRATADDWLEEAERCIAQVEAGR